MCWRKPVAHLIAGILAALCGGLAFAQGGGADSIPGSYYYKSIGILEIRQEGNSVVTEFPWERDWLNVLLDQKTSFYQKDDEAGKRMLEKLRQYRHRGRLIDPATVEFADFDATKENLLKYYGLSPADQLRQVKEAWPESAAKTLGRYVERWRLLPGGRLEVDGAIPAVPVSYSPAAEEGVEEMQRFREGLSKALKTPGSQTDYLGAFRKDNPALCKRVCGFKIRNASELAAWKALDAGKHAEAAPLFQKAAKEQPGWPFPLFGECWARIGTSEFDLARQALKNGRAALTPEYRPFLEAFDFLLEDQILSYELHKTAPAEDYVALTESWKEKWVMQSGDRNALGALTRKKLRDWSAQDFQAAASVVQNCPVWQDLEKGAGMRGRGPLLPIGAKALSIENLASRPVPNFVELQSVAKVLVLAGHGGLAQNDLKKAAYHYTIPIRLGQNLRHGSVISHLIGIAMEGIGAQALLDLFEDGRIQDPQSLAYIAQTADIVLKAEPEANGGRIFAYECHIVPFTSDPFLDYLLSSSALGNSREPEVRARSTQARLALVKAACAVKSKALKPPFPAQLDAGALPEDPFLKGQKIRYIPGAGGPATVFSVGPNRENDHASVAYDPTNGTTSAGDILVRIR